LPAPIGSPTPGVAGVPNDFFNLAKWIGLVVPQLNAASYGGTTLYVPPPPVTFLPMTGDVEGTTNSNLATALRGIPFTGKRANGSNPQNNDILKLVNGSIVFAPQA
jgi:hypothetical protein